MNFWCWIFGHDTEAFTKTETYMGYSGILQNNKEVRYIQCRRCKRVWKEVWCGFSEFYWQEV